MAKTQIPGTQVLDGGLKNDDVASDAAIAITKLSLVSALDNKTTPVDNDTFPGGDSAASGIWKKFTWANIKATLKTYFDGLYSSFANLVEDTTPQLGGYLELNKNHLRFLPDGLTDHSFEGSAITETAGENFTIGEIGYLKSDGKIWKTDADAEATTKGRLYMATASINADASGVFLLYGIIRDDSFTWTVGGIYCVGLTAGAIETMSVTTGDFPRIVGYGERAHVFFFCPDNVWLENT